MTVAFLRQIRPVTKKGVAYNWDNKGYDKNTTGGCKYGLNSSGWWGGGLEHNVNYTKMLNLHIF